MIKTTLALAALALIATSGLASARTVERTNAHAQVERSYVVRHSYNSHAPGYYRIAPRGSLAWREFHDIPTNNLDD